MLHIYCDRDEWDPTWDRLELAGSVLIAFAAFVDALELEDEQRAQWFKPALDSATTTLALSASGAWTYVRQA